MKRTWPLLIVALAAVAAAFSVGVTDGHIAFDDWGYTLGCPFVRDGLSRANVLTALREMTYGAIWMPVTFVSYMADVSLFGGGWRVHHAVNVACHLVNVALVFFFLRRMLHVLGEAEGRPTVLACIGATLVWALHPMRAEAVTYVASRKEELWTLFSLVGLLAYDRFLCKGGWRPYALAAAGFVLAAMSKPTAMAFPFLAAAVQFAVRRERRVSCLWLMPFLAGAVALGGLTLCSQAGGSSADEVVGLYSSGFGWCCLNAAVSTGLYFWYTLVPFGIHMDYRAVFDGWPVNGALGLGALAATAAVAGLAVRRGDARTRRLVLTAGALFLFSLAPTLGVFGYVNGDQAMADRYAYFPHLALALLLAAGLARGLSRGGRTRCAVLAALVAALAMEVAVLVPVERSFESDAAFSARVLAYDPEHWRALRLQGNELCARQNRMDEGVAMLRKSLWLHSSQRTAESLAYVLAVRGRAEDAAEVRRLCAAVAASPSRDKTGMMLDALGFVGMKAGDYGQAAHYFEAALHAPQRQHAPDQTCLRLGQCLARLGRVGDARHYLSRAAQSRDEDVAFHARVALRSLQRHLSCGRVDR